MTLLIFIFLALASISNAAAIPTISSYVTDNAGVLSSSAKSQLENDLRGLEKSTNGVQYVIYIEKEYPKEYSLEEYALKIAEQNKIGKKGNDNGILLYVAINDRKYRWEVGYGVESTLNSPLLGRLSREYLAPNFKEGNYEKGILEAYDATKRLLLNSNDADILSLKNSANEQDKSSPPLWLIALFFLFVIIFWTAIILAIRRSQAKQQGKKRNDSIYHGAALGLFTGGFGRGGFGGGSGGFGGFSGGGGSFGGGGGSGRW